MSSPAASWLDALAMHAADNGFGTLSSDLWVGRRSDDPALPAAATILTEVPGLVDENMGSGNDVLRPMFSVYVRGDVEDYAVARAKLGRLWALYTAITERTIHGFRFMRVGNPGATPTYLGRDDNERPAFTIELWTWQPQPAPEVWTYAP